MTRGLVTGCIFFSGATGSIKLPVATASAIDWLTEIFILDASSIVSAWADAQSLCVEIVCCHVVLHVGNVIGLYGSWFGESILIMEESSDSGYVRAVTLLVQFLGNFFIIIIVVFIIEITVEVIIIIGGGDWLCVIFFKHLTVLHLRPCLSQLDLVVMKHIAFKLWLLLLGSTFMDTILLLLGLLGLLLLVLFYKLLLDLHHKLRFADAVC